MKKTPTPAVGYLEKPEMEALLQAPNQQTVQGRRDYAVLLFLYNTGARATEVAEVQVGALSFHGSPSVRLLGKGGKVLRMWPGYSADMLQEVNKEMAVATNRPVKKFDPKFAPKIMTSGCEFPRKSS